MTETLYLSILILAMCDIRDVPAVVLNLERRADRQDRTKKIWEGSFEVVPPKSKPVREPFVR